MGIRTQIVYSQILSEQELSLYKCISCESGVQVRVKKQSIFGCAEFQHDRVAIPQHCQIIAGILFVRSDKCLANQHGRAQGEDKHFDDICHDGLTSNSRERFSRATLSLWVNDPSKGYLRGSVCGESAMDNSTYQGYKAEDFFIHA